MLASSDRCRAQGGCYGTRREWGELRSAAEVQHGEYADECIPLPLHKHASACLMFAACVISLC
jgi:hypothetical protein